MLLVFLAIGLYWLFVLILLGLSFATLGELHRSLLTMWPEDAVQYIRLVAQSSLGPKSGYFVQWVVNEQDIAGKNFKKFIENMEIDFMQYFLLCLLYFVKKKKLISIRYTRTQDFQQGTKDPVYALPCYFQYLICVPNHLPRDYKKTAQQIIRHKQGYTFGSDYAHHHYLSLQQVTPSVHFSTEQRPQCSQWENKYVPLPTLKTLKSTTWQKKYQKSIQYWFL